MNCCDEHCVTPFCPNCGRKMIDKDLLPLTALEAYLRGKKAGGDAPEGIFELWADAVAKAIERLRSPPIFLPPPPFNIRPLVTETPIRYESTCICTDHFRNPTCPVHSVSIQCTPQMYFKDCVPQCKSAVGVREVSQ